MRDTSLGVVLVRDVRERVVAGVATLALDDPPHDADTQCQHRDAHESTEDDADRCAEVSGPETRRVEDEYRNDHEGCDDPHGDERREDSSRVRPVVHVPHLLLESCGDVQWTGLDEAGGHHQVVALLPLLRRGGSSVEGVVARLVPGVAQVGIQPLLPLLRCGGDGVEDGVEAIDVLVHGTLRVLP